jgi:PadR family transcriptional regulator PadR
MKLENALRIFEYEVLLVLLSLEAEKSYLLSCHKAMEKNTGRDISIGALYTCLHRMEEKGYLLASSGLSTPTRGGRKKRYFKVSDRGIVAARKTHERIERLVELRRKVS